MSAAAARTHLYGCACGHELQVFGYGRHRRYFELPDRTLTEPVITRVCPACHQALPGKNRF